MIVFLASTFTDLTEYRSAVAAAIRGIGHEVESMEDFGAAPRPPLDECLRRVSQSDVLVCVVGASYGSVAHDGMSYTEAEARHAHRVRIPVLAYLLSEERPVLPRFVAYGEDRRRLQNFKEWLGRESTTAGFGTPEDLARRVSLDLQRERPVSQEGNSVTRALHKKLRSTAGRPFDVCSITANNLDVVYEVDRVSPDYETEIGEPHLCAGGSGANTAAAAAGLGLRSTIVGIVAHDDEGKLLRRELEMIGVDAQLLLGISSDSGRFTGRTTVYTDGEGRRSIYVQPGVNALLASELQRQSLLGRLYALVDEIRYLHLTSFTTLAEMELQQDVLKRVGREVVISVNPGAIYARLGADRIAPLLRRANLLFLYEEQLDSLLANSSAATGRPYDQVTDKIDSLLRWRAREGVREPLAVIVKRPIDLVRKRKAGYLTIGCGTESLEEAVPINVMGSALRGAPGVVDATGAGDALAAGIMLGLEKGRNFLDCGYLAFLMAVEVSKGWGGREALPTKSEAALNWAILGDIAGPPEWL
jgi:sugar/nucleoside kinase (ribokinase family)